MSYIYILSLHLYCYLYYALFFQILVIFKIHVLLSLKMNEDDVCLTNCTTTHIILWDKRCFIELTITKANVSTISNTIDLVEGSERANIMLPNETRFFISDALYSSKSRRNLLSFKDIRRNGYHIKNMNEGNVKYLYITSVISSQKLTVEKLSNFFLWVVSYNYKVYWVIRCRELEVQWLKKFYPLAW